MVEVPEDLLQALRVDGEAWSTFLALAEQDQRHLVEVIEKARDQGHRERRIRWIVSSLSGPWVLLTAVTVSALF